MFLLHPDDALLPLDELLEKIWQERLTPAHRAQCLAEAQARGVTYMDLMREEADRLDADMADPIEREKWLRKCEDMHRWRAMPYGPDLLRWKDGV